MNEEERDILRAEHWQTTLSADYSRAEYTPFEGCALCYEPWPCRTTILVDAYEHQLLRYDSLVTALQHGWKLDDWLGLERQLEIQSRNSS